jgi:hypothetical protein
MRTLENKIIEDVRNTLLREDLDDLKDEYFENKLNIFKFFEKFKMNELTLKYIKMFEKVLNKIAEKDFTEEKFEEIKNAFQKKEKQIKWFYENDIEGRNYVIDKHNNLQIQERFEELSFVIYEFAKREYRNLENKTESEKQELLKDTSLIHNYLRENSFAAVADAIADVKLACKKD